ncbi:uncharacterized protein LOC144653959 isoform X2 [Oculina patagonica]
MFRIIMFYFTAAGLAGLLSNCKGQVTNPDGRQNQSDCTYFFYGSNIIIKNRMAVNRETCLYLDSEELRVYNKSTRMGARLATCPTFGQGEQSGVVNEEFRKKFDLKYFSFECSLSNSSNHHGHRDVHSELIGDKTAMKQLPFDECIFIILCSDSHGSTFRYSAACPIVNETRESISTKSARESEEQHVTDYPSTADPVSQSYVSVVDPVSKKVENVSDAKKETLSSYLVISTAIALVLHYYAS